MPSGINIPNDVILNLSRTLLCSSSIVNQKLNRKHEHENHENETHDNENIAYEIESVKMKSHGNEKLEEHHDHRCQCLTELTYRMTRQGTRENEEKRKAEQWMHEL